MTFPHPETGELLDSREDFLAAIKEMDERIGQTYRTRARLQEALIERSASPELPEPRYRTVTQEKVVRCPRCGGRLNGPTGDQ